MILRKPDELRSGAKVRLGSDAIWVVDYPPEEDGEDVLVRLYSSVSYDGGGYIRITVRLRATDLIEVVLP